MHHAYNTYATNVLEAFMTATKLDIKLAKAECRRNLELIYNSYLELKPASQVAEKLVSLRNA